MRMVMGQFQVNCIRSGPSAEVPGTDSFLRNLEHKLGRALRPRKPGPKKMGRQS